MTSLATLLCPRVFVIQSASRTAPWFLLDLDITDGCGAFLSWKPTTDEWVLNAIVGTS